MSATIEAGGRRGGHEPPHRDGWPRLQKLNLLTWRNLSWPPLPPHPWPCSSGGPALGCSPSGTPCSCRGSPRPQLPQEMSPCCGVGPPRAAGWRSAPAGALQGCRGIPAACGPGAPPALLLLGPEPSAASPSPWASSSACARSALSETCFPGGAASLGQGSAGPCPAHRGPTAPSHHLGRDRLHSVEN